MALHLSRLRLGLPIPCLIVASSFLFLGLCSEPSEPQGFVQVEPPGSLGKAEQEPLPQNAEVASDFDPAKVFPSGMNPAMEKNFSLTVAASPRVKGVKTTLVALGFIVALLLVHMMMTPGKLDEKFRVSSLSSPSAKHLASAAAVLGMLMSGLGDIFHSLALRSSGVPLLNPRASFMQGRGKPQIFIGAVLFVC